MQPQVLAFFHADSNTFTYVVADAATGAAAVIDPALEYAADSGVVGSRRRRPSLRPSSNTDGRCNGCWKLTRMPITCLQRSG